MELLKLYETYNDESKAYVAFINELIETEFSCGATQEIGCRLLMVKEELEQLMEKVSDLEVEEVQEDNLKDLRYLTMDLLFLATDLENFFKHQELGRFKMRALNYLNKRRRAELFSEGNNLGSCVMGKME